MRAVILALILVLTLPLWSLAENQPAGKNYKKEFLERYDFFVTGKEKKEFKKLKTDEARDEFIANFWQIRDTNPDTPENEYKNLIDQRIADIEEEMFALRGFLFSSNRGLKGDPAQVYLYYGSPTSVTLLINGRSYVDIMLWIYADENNLEKFRFLFYKRHNLSNFVFFRPFSISSPLYDLIRVEGQYSVQDVYYELLESDGGQMVLLALQSFSDYGGINLEDALKTPMPAALTAEKEGARVVSPAVSSGVKPEDRLDNKAWNSFLPMLFKIENGDSGKPVVKLLMRNDAPDWSVDGNGIVCDVGLHVYISGPKAGKKPLVYDRALRFHGPKTALTDYAKGYFAVNMDELNGIIGDLASGRYCLRFRLENLATGKYNAQERCIDIP